MSYSGLGPQGYLVLKKVLSPEECKTLKKSFTREALDLVFQRRGYPLDLDDSENLLLFTQPSLRTEKFGKDGKSATWRDGNPRKPLLSKNCGMIDIHYNLDQLRLITLNPRLYEKMSNVYGVENLVHLGPERFSIKAQGAPDMPKHIDSNLFNESVNYRVRIQSLVCLEVGNDVTPRDSGTINLYINFEKYWKFAGELFHPTTGLFPFPNLKSRFFVFPTGAKGWDKYYEPLFREHAKGYTRYLHRGKKPHDPKVFKFYRELSDREIKVPKRILPLEWTPIVLEPGDMVLWHQYLPHQSLRNKSKTPRIVAYYSLHPIGPEWFGSQEQLWVKKQFSEGKFFYSTDAGFYPTEVRNPEEYSYLKEQKLLFQVRKISQETSLSRRLSGQEDWFSPEYQLTFESRYWKHTPRFLPSDVFGILYPKAQKLCSPGNGSRLSCIFSETKGLYGKLPTYGWDSSQIVQKIKTLVEKETEAVYDYCLMHIYRDGKDSINWHNDRENLNSYIASVSLGATRKFRIRRHGQTRGWEEEFELHSGDLFFMKPPHDKFRGFQEVYQHCVPKQLKVTEPRINLTFRPLE